MSSVPKVAGDGRLRRILGVAGLAVGQAVAAGVAAFATRDIFGALHAGGALSATALAGLALSGLAIGGLRIAERTVGERLGCDYAAAVRERLFMHAAGLPPSELARRTTGGLSLRFVGDLTALRGWVSKGLVRLISAAVTIPAALLVLALLDPRLAIAGGIPVALGLVAIVLLGSSLGTAHRELRKIRAKLASEMTERLPHGAALGLFGRLGIERAKLGRRSAAVAEASVERARLAASARAAPDAAAGLGAAAILWTAWSQGIPPATAAGALAALGLLVQPLHFLAEVRDRRQAWWIAHINLERALSAPAFATARRRRAKVRTDAAALELDQARFRGSAALTASLEPGQTALLQGGMGAGKSALLMAAAGLERPTSGSISVFGQPPWTVPRSTVGYVGPAAPILRGSLRRNVVLGVRSRLDDRQIAEALRAAGLGDLLERLGGLRGRVGEAGRDLTGRERGRLLLVRALLARPRLLLIDAADARLDREMMDLLFEQIDDLGAAALVASEDESVRRPGSIVWRIGADAAQGSTGSDHVETPRLVAVACPKAPNACR